jgi:hypothetical protein
VQNPLDRNVPNRRMNQWSCHGSII